MPFNLDRIFTVLLCLRMFLHLLPFTVRRFIVKTVLGLPLWFSRFITNISTMPIYDERKWVHKIEKNAWKGVWIVPNLDSVEQAEIVAQNCDLVIFYVHGGFYCTGSSVMYMNAFQLIISRLRSEHNIMASILSLEYSLSPEHVWPKARDEAMEAYQYITDTIGIPTSKIIFAGDSAGANVVAATLLTMKSENRRSQPAAVALLSPWADFSIDQPSFATNRSDWMSSKQVKTFVGYFISNFKTLSETSRRSIVRNPLISPLYGDFRGFCPMFISYGEEELLRASIEQFRLNLEKDGVCLTTLKRKNAHHVWLIFSLVATSKEIFETDCKIFIDWMASIINGSSNAAEPDQLITAQ